MRVLVAGATSVLGRATVRELICRGHDVVALSRSSNRAAPLVLAGARCIVADVLDEQSTRKALEQARPDAVATLLIQLPRNGPTRYGHFRATRRLWDIGVPNVIRAAQGVGVTRYVGESVLFGYGYADHGEIPLDEDAPDLDSDSEHQRHILSSLRGMEQTVLDAGGTILRYGVFKGATVPSERYLCGLMRSHVPVLPGGATSLLSFVGIEDAARATVAALERGTVRQTLNICDDAPMQFHEYARSLATDNGLPRPRAVPARLIRPVMPYTALILNEVSIPMSNARARTVLGWTPSSTPPQT